MDKISDAVKTLLGHTKGVFCDEPGEAYQEYLEAVSPGREELNGQRRADVSGLPVFAVAIAGDSEGKAMEATRASLEAQTYSRWKITSDPEGDEYDYIMYMWPGDTLSPDALFRYASAARGCDLLFCDEDRRLDGRRGCPDFKPELSCITELSYDMLGSGAAAAKGLFLAAGGMKGASGDDRYDYNLRCVRLCTKARRVPGVLYTCAQYREVTPAARLSVEKYAGENTRVMPGQWPGSFRVEAVVRRPRAAVIIHNKNSYKPLMRLLASLDPAIDKYVTVYIADRGTTDGRTLRCYDILAKNKAAHIYRGGNVSLPALFNGAAREAGRDVTVFMESAAEALDPNWIRDLMSQTMRGCVAAAGPKLIGPDGRIMYTGTVIGIGGWQGTLYSGTEDDGRTPRKRRFANAVRAVSGLSAFCMMVKTDIFFDAGGFDQSFVSAGFDTEFCLRMGGKGYSSVYAPNVVIKAHAPLMDIAAAWGKDRLRYYDAVRGMLIDGDPYYNPNFDYSSALPRAAALPRPAAELNERYREKQ